MRLRGTIHKADATSLVVRTNDGREISLATAEPLRVVEIVPIDPSAIQSGAFVGTGAVPGADGSLVAVEVYVFAESARKANDGRGLRGEPPNATLTNATIVEVRPGPDVRTMTLRYKDGAKTIQVPNGVPVVTTKPGHRSLVVAGAKTTVIAQTRDGQPVATAVLVGRNGFEPPM
ncbi:MAG TPA: hypothetical protein VH041_14215 [Caldimonas sp.]|jgi:hypothetical protein|nr:hypothetical protein [Caldimonas sp.]HEX4235446.1 hypothetical protein [Caldimonas sp.]